MSLPMHRRRIGCRKRTIGSRPFRTELDDPRKTALFHEDSTVARMPHIISLAADAARSVRRRPLQQFVAQAIEHDSERVEFVDTQVELVAELPAMNEVGDLIEMAWSVIDG